MRRTKTIFTISFLSLLLVASSICHGYDTDLYVLSGVNIPPNVIIIMDSSASMDEVSSSFHRKSSPPGVVPGCGLVGVLDNFPLRLILKNR